jgi:hypothetical protein
MAGLTVTTVGQKISGPGTTGNNLITLTVVRADGTGVAGLTAANFALSTTNAPGGGSGLKVTASSFFTPGVYGLTVVPASGAWFAGQYIHSVAVTAGTDRGLTVGTLVV